MGASGKLKILFVAGFGPIVRDTAESRRLYRDVWAFPSKRRAASIFIRKLSKAQKRLLCGPFLKRRSLVLARITGPMTFRSHKPGLSLMLRASKKRRRNLKSEDIECWSRTRKNRGAKL